MLTKREKTSLTRLTVQWLDFLDIYKIEGCTEQDVVQGMETGGPKGAQLAEKMDKLTRKEWRAVMSEVIEAVNTELGYNEEFEEA